MSNMAKMATFHPGKQSISSRVPSSEEAPGSPLQMFVFALHALRFYFGFCPAVFFILLLCSTLYSPKRLFKDCISGQATDFLFLNSDNPERMSKRSDTTVRTQWSSLGLREAW